MKKHVSIFLAIMVLCFAMIPMASFAATSTGGRIVSTGGAANLEERLRNVPVFKFWNHENGIGYGNCPVYTAPSENAFRCANGKASVATNVYMSEAGYVGGWLLVRYETNNGGYRVGYIPPRYVRGFKSKMGTRQFDCIPVTAAGTIYVTDNPLLQGSSFARLDDGEEFYILGKYTYYGDWWYIECTVDGQTARGFIDRQSSGFYLGSAASGATYTATGDRTIYTPSLPEYSPLGTTYIGDVKIDGGSTGDRKIVRQQPSTSANQTTVVYPGNRYPCYATRIGSTGKEWYYIWIEVDNAWGWVSSGVAILFV